MIMIQDCIEKNVKFFSYSLSSPQSSFRNGILDLPDVKKLLFSNLQWLLYSFKSKLTDVMCRTRIGQLIIN